MDHEHNPTERGSSQVQVPHLRLHDDGEAPADFVPMRLVLQPSGAVLDVGRPDMLIGRHTEADIRLPLPDVSRRHCRLQYLDGHWQVIDLNSLNGIHVNGEQVLQAPLDQGDLLRIGGFTFTVELTPRSADLDAADHVQSILKTLSVPPQRRAS
ncbi:MAG: FHA domain-containing protein [Gemmataceae bacterium]